jgi:hypothetical protein
VTPSKKREGVKVSDVVNLHSTFLLRGPGYALPQPADVLAQLSSGHIGHIAFERLIETIALPGSRCAALHIFNVLRVSSSYEGGLGSEG